MSKHLQRDLDALKNEILAMGAMVEEATNKAIIALSDRRPELADAVRDGDSIIDQKEVEVEESCLKVLALHQPVAADLRFIVAVMKVNNDLERMGDLAVNIAKRASYLCSHPAISVSVPIQDLGDKVRTMVRESLDALVNLDVALAHRVRSEDDAVDNINAGFFVKLQAAMHADPDIIERAINLLSASRHLERIADHATNIAEDVIFMVEGEIVRHQPSP